LREQECRLTGDRRYRKDENEISTLRYVGEKDWGDERVHSNTTSLGEVVLLGLSSVEGTTSLEHGLVDTSTTSDDTNGSTGISVDRLLGSGRKTDTSATSVDIVSDDGSVVTGSTGEGTSVSGLLLDVADDGTFRELGEGENVSDGEGSLLSAEDESTGGKTFGSDEGLGPHLVTVRVTEDDTGEGSTTVNPIIKIPSSVSPPLSNFFSQLTVRGRERSP